MASRVFNPFGGIDVEVPETFRDNFHQYIRSDDYDSAPFPRMVDLWFLGLCVAARLKIRLPEAPAGSTYKIIDGTIFNGDPWRIQAICLLAIAHTQDIATINEPNKMMRIANLYAMAGIPKVIEFLKQDPKTAAIFNVSDNIVSLLRTEAAL